MPNTAYIVAHQPPDGAPLLFCPEFRKEHLPMLVG